MDTNTKILFVITKGNWGGAQKYVFELATRLPKDRYAVKVVHGWGDVLPQKLEQHSIPTLRIEQLGRDVNPIKDILSFFKLFKIFRHERPGIVHLNSSKIGGIGAIAARLAGVRKIVFTVHGFAFKEDRPAYQKKIITFLSWLSIVFCTDVIFISQTEKSIAEQWPYIKHKTHLIYNGIATPDFFSRDEAREKIANIIGISPEIFNGKILIGTIGELTKNKGYSYALPAIRNINDCLYIIIGEGEDRVPLTEKIVELKAEDKIFLAGFIPEASRYLKAFDIFILPSLKEGMPYVLLESGLAQIPVITTPIGGIEEMIENLTTGFFIEPGSQESIREVTQQVVSHTSERHEIATAFLQTIHKKFSIETMLSETINTYHQMR